jgi:hypothetical protein
MSCECLSTPIAGARMQRPARQHAGTCPQPRTHHTWLVAVARVTIALCACWGARCGAGLLGHQHDLCTPARMLVCILGVRAVSAAAARTP